MSRSSLLFCSTRFSRVSFQAVISSVWRRISSRAASSEVVMALNALASSPSSSFDCTSSSVSSLPWAICRAPCTSAPTRPARLRASAAPISAATKPETPIQNTVSRPSRRTGDSASRSGRSTTTPNRISGMRA